MRSGQAALIVLLIIAVALGFGLSIISQSTTDVRISKQEQESARAFNAAEAGIEEALQKLSIVAGAGPQELSGLDTGVESSYEVTGANQLEAVYQENDTAQVSLLNSDPTLTKLTVNWVKANSTVENPRCTGESQTPASLEITVIKGSSGNYAKRSFAYNACPTLGNGMSTNGVVNGSQGYLKRRDIPIESDDVLVRIRPIYNQASLWIRGNVDLPLQGYAIASTAQVGTADQSTAVKAIEVTRTEPGTPSIFDFVLFSGSNLVK